MAVIRHADWYLDVRSDGVARYGLRLYLSDGAVWEIPDVDSAPDASLPARLRGEWVDAEQLRYLLEDYLADRYTV